jgi:hypothetical protein
MKYWCAACDREVSEPDSDCRDCQIWWLNMPQEDDDAPHLDEALYPPDHSPKP